MEITACIQCGVEIEGKGIHYQGHHFCGDDCCEEYDTEFASKSEPAIDELDDTLDLEVDDDLGYTEKDPLAEDDDLLDDDFDIREEDF